MIITNLFSIFDPSIRIFRSRWIVRILIILILPFIKWNNSNASSPVSSLSSMYKIEVGYVTPQPKKGVYRIIIIIFLRLALYNFLALFPFIYSITSHASTNLPIAYSLWIACIIFAIFRSIKRFLCHLIPTGTPLALIRFIVIVEILRNLIRPLALTFRLTANIIAGHLLISLIGGRIIILPPLALLRVRILQSLLVTIEMGVSLIQAYVFATLLLLYLSER